MDPRGGSSTISPRSSSGAAAGEGGVRGGGASMEAALAAAACTSRGELEAGRGSEAASSGKLRMAEEPFIVSAATSCARAAISAVAKVPSQIRFFFRGSRISDTHFPHVRILTPLYTECLLSLPVLLPLLSLALPRFLELDDDDDGEEAEPTAFLVSDSEDGAGSTIV
ncbi:hypothetical protein V8G54_013076 [Vigna mungo]|uniref:Uncharacterized protein n=1 Tax=Vigna mungo TaxID=3915 RepID=A0AAQ3NSI6_VIGMU